MKMFKLATICLVLSASMFAASASGEQRKIYIAYMGSLPHGEYSPPSHHAEILRQIVDPSFTNKSLVRSFKRSFNGFAALLTEQEKEKLASVNGILSVFPSQHFRPQTTRSWDFMGLPRTAKRRPITESDVIIGVIDFGIWPESESFNDEGLGPIPEKWKGECAGGPNFKCNKKIIGARSYTFESLDITARDKNGHGTHVASIAAGREVNGANFYGLAEGIARGGVPSAKLAIYKACEKRCFNVDVLAAFDDAIADGVDIISISVGGENPFELTSDPIAIGSFHALDRGILTVSSAGNDGPRPYSILSIAPWLVSVAASYTDRRIVDKVILGEGTVLEGHSINTFTSTAREFPIVYGKEVTSTCSEAEARNCSLSCLDSRKIQEKVVICDNHEFLRNATLDPGAYGYITMSGGVNFSDVTSLRIAALNRNEMALVKKYKIATNNPSANILRSEAIKSPPAPFVASFSSRGPAKWMPDIGKPDVTAPGVEVLASYSPLAPLTRAPLDKRSVKYNILSGTSMACPHVAAAAAYVKSFHPNWSPSAIKSALMTTAWEMDGALNQDAEFAYGSGHINPVKATDPGLVYETSKEDYLKIWCNMSRTFTSVNTTACPEMLTLRELNYPSMTVEVVANSAFKVYFPRTVTNVGPTNSKYVAFITSQPELKISVEPNSLQFTAVNQKKSFVVTVKGKIKTGLTIKSNSLVWKDGIHKARSPIVAYTLNNTSKGKAGASTRPPSFYKIFVIVLIISTLL